MRQSGTQSAPLPAEHQSFDQPMTQPQQHWTHDQPGTGAHHKADIGELGPADVAAFDAWLAQWPNFGVNGVDVPMTSAPPAQMQSTGMQPPLTTRLDYIPFPLNFGSDADAPRPPDPELRRRDSVMGLSVRNANVQDRTTDSDDENDEADCTDDDDDDMDNEDDECDDVNRLEAEGSEIDSDTNRDESDDQAITGSALACAAPQPRAPLYGDFLSQGVPREASATSPVGTVIHDPRKRKAAVLGASGDGGHNTASNRANHTVGGIDRLGGCPSTCPNERAIESHNRADSSSWTEASNATPWDYDTNQENVDWDSLMRGPYDGTLLP